MFKSEDFNLESRGRQLASKYVKPLESDSSEDDDGESQKDENPSVSTVEKMISAHVAVIVSKGVAGKERY